MCDFNLKGLAIGLQSETGEMMAIFMAVMMHKAVMAFSLGLNIAQSSLSVCIALRSSNVAHYTRLPSPTLKVRSFVFSSITFSLASPLGVAIGQWESSRLILELCILSTLLLPTGIGLSGLPPSIPQQICNGVLQVPIILTIVCAKHTAGPHTFTSMLAKCEFQGIAGGTFLYITFFEVVMLKIFIFKSVFLLSIGVTT